MHLERDKFLTEAMGECWHEWSQDIQHVCCDESLGYVKCLKCNATTPALWRFSKPSFSNWEGFGKLWEWAQKQEWWIAFQKSTWSYCETIYCECGCGDSDWNNYIINPDNLAGALYEFLKERELK